VCFFLWSLAVVVAEDAADAAVAAADGERTPLKTAEETPAASAASQAANAPLTDEEIRNRLERTVSVEWQEMPLQDACREIANLAGVSVVLDPAADKDMSITLAMRDARLANILAWLTEIARLHYQIRDQAIFITPRPIGERILVIYPAADLLRAPRDAYPPGEEPEEDEEKRALSADELQELIKKFVAPGTWQ